MTTRRGRSRTGEQSEAAFQSAVIGLARVYGWRIFHAPDNRPAGTTGRPQRMAAPEGAGFPDLILIRGRRLIAAELKTRTGRVDPRQHDWLAAFTELADAVARTVRVAGAWAAATASHDDDLVAAAALAALLDDTDRATWPSVEAYLWRPANWATIQATLGQGQAHRADLDPYIPPS